MDIAALKQAALEATPGPWATHIDGTCSSASPSITTVAVDEYGDPYDIAELQTSHVETGEARKSGEFPGSYAEKPHRFALTHDGQQVLNDAAYIAAANPAAVLALIESHERLVAALQELLSSQLALMPSYKEGKDAQDAWADRRATARNNAAAILADVTGAA